MAGTSFTKHSRNRIGHISSTQFCLGLRGHTISVQPPPRRQQLPGRRSIHSGVCDALLGTNFLRSGPSERLKTALTSSSDCAPHRSCAKDCNATLALMTQNCIQFQLRLRFTSSVRTDCNTCNDDNLPQCGHQSGHLPCLHLDAAPRTRRAIASQREEDRLGGQHKKVSSRTA